MTEHAKELLKGAYDLHTHPTPDVRPRKGDDFELAERFIKAGMKGFAIKAHYTPTAERAYYVRKRYPDFEAVGGIVLNSTVGGINPIAVETSARLGGKFVWFPTVDSKQDIDRLINNVPVMVGMEIKLGKAGLGPFGITILDDDGNLIPEVHYILEIIKEYDMILSTAHISHEETFKLIQEGKNKGLTKMLVAHVDWKGTHYTVEEQKKLIAMGAMLEHSYATPCVPFEELCAEMRGIGPSHFMIDTDLGIVTMPSGKSTGFLLQGEAPWPDEGMGLYVDVLLENGFSDEEIRCMIVKNPEYLLHGTH